MLDAPLLGCPHCGKPIAYAPELASRTAACPHCRGPFTMPSSPPGVAAPPPPQQSPAAVQPSAPAPASARRPANLGFNPDDVPAPYKPGERQGKEKFCYPNAESASLIVCIAGVVFTLFFTGFMVVSFIVPTFQLPGARAFFIAFLASLAAFALLVGGIAGSLLLRHLVLVIVDAARKLR